MIGLKCGLYRAEKGQDVPTWMYEVFDKESGTMLPVEQCSFKFNVPCKIYIDESLKTYIIPIKPMSRCKRGLLHFKHLGGYMLDGEIKFKPNHNHLIGSSECKISAIRIARKFVNFKNKAKVKNIKEAA